MRERMRKLKHIVVAFKVLIVIWQIGVTFGSVHEALFPSPWKVLLAEKELICNGNLMEGIASSMFRFLVGFLSSIIVGVSLGIILGSCRIVWNYVNPIIQFLRPISPIAWLPFIVLWFGIGDIPAIVIIFIAGFFPILLSTVAAVGRVDNTYLKVAKNYGLNHHQTFAKVIVPAALPNIMTGIHLALSTAWVLLVAGEMVGAQSGLGYLIIDSRNNLRLDQLMATMITIGVIGLILDGVIHLIETRLIHS